LEEKNKTAMQEAEFDIGAGESSSLVQTFKDLQKVLLNNQPPLFLLIFW